MDLSSITRNNTIYFVSYHFAPKPSGLVNSRCRSKNSTANTVPAIHNSIKSCEVYIITASN